MARQNQFSLREIQDAIKEARGNVVKAADLLGAGRRTVYNYVRRYKSLENLIREERRFTETTRLDVAERNLDDRLEAGDWRATEFVLATVGKKRGYVRGQLLQGDPENPVSVVSTSADQWIEQQKRQAEAAGVTLEK